MNKKGFTLVELLATIIILGLLALLTSTSVNKVIKDSKSDLYDSQIKLIKDAAKTWGAENLYKLPDSGECKYLTIKNLQDYGILDKSIKNPKTNKKIDDNIKIKITTNKTGYGNDVTSYEIDPDSIEGCSHAMPCTLISGEANTIGSKYECEVSPGTKYNFYVLSHEDNGTTNLIMDRNICEDGTPTDANKDDKCTVAWNSSESNTGGPVTAMNYLYNATKSWINIPSLNYTYNDRNFQGIATDNTTIGYTSFVSNNGEATITALDGTTITKIGSKTEPLKARMPIYTTNSTNSLKKEVTDSNGSNEYLYENLDSTNNGEHWSGESGKQPTNNISGIYGYWTLSSLADNFSFAWIVYFSGVVGDDSVDSSSGFGVRPVINIKI